MRRHFEGNLTKFADAANIQRVTLHRVMVSGERYENISVNFAVRVCDVADGAIRVEDFCSITAIPKEQADREEPWPAKRVAIRRAA